MMSWSCSDQDSSQKVNNPSINRSGTSSSIRPVVKAVNMKQTVFSSSSSDSSSAAYLHLASAAPHTTKANVEIKASFSILIIPILSDGHPAWNGWTTFQKCDYWWHTAWSCPNSQMSRTSTPRPHCEHYWSKFSSFSSCPTECWWNSFQGIGR